jgi:hypothetical protein
MSTLFAAAPGGGLPGNRQHGGNKSAPARRHPSGFDHYVSASLAHGGGEKKGPGRGLLQTLSAVNWPVTVSSDVTRIQRSGSGSASLIAAFGVGLSSRVSQITRNSDSQCQIA